MNNIEILTQYTESNPLGMLETESRHVSGYMWALDVYGYLHPVFGETGVVDYESRVLLFSLTGSNGADGSEPDDLHAVFESMCNIVRKQAELKANS